MTADTYTSVLPDIARTTAKAAAAQIMKAADATRPHVGPTLASRSRSMITAGA